MNTFIQVKFTLSSKCKCDSEALIFICIECELSKLHTPSARKWKILSKLKQNLGLQTSTATPDD
jgi:hypothetical protein